MILKSRYRNLVLRALFFSLVGGASMTVIASSAQASADQWLRKTSVTGQIRQYDFYRHFNNLLPKQYGQSLGGWLNAHTAPLAGFSADVGFYTAQSLGVNPSNIQHQHLTLPSMDVTALGQAYLQYKGRGLLARVGDQPLDTPWAKSDDYRMIPPLYQGLYADYALPLNGMHLQAARMFRYKPWQASKFDKGDSGYRLVEGTHSKFNAAAPVPSVDTPGFVTVGLTYGKRLNKASAWYYDYYERERLAYAHLQHVLPIHPFGQTYFAGLQYGHTWDSANQKAPYDNVDSSLYGVQLGAIVPHNIIKLSYDYVPVNTGHFRAGGFITPYQAGAYTGSTFAVTVLQNISTNTGVPGQGYTIADITHFGKFKMINAIGQFFYKKATGVHGAFPKASALSASSIMSYEVTPHFTVANTLAWVNEDAIIQGITIDYLKFRYSFSIN